MLPTARNGDEDSVFHAWKTTPTDIAGEIVHLDAGIAPLVVALNRLPGVETHASCEGHPHSEIETRAYVSFSWRGVDLEVLVWPDQVKRFADEITAQLAHGEERKRPWKE